jgi:hypothetical protein
MVELEGHPGRVYFRFYDPRTLTTLLSTCTPRQAEEFFGGPLASGVGAFFAEARDGILARYPRPPVPPA